MTRKESRQSLAIIDEICERFEEEWLTGRVPNIDDYLNHPSVDRDELLEYLLPIDREYRQRNGLDSSSILVGTNGTDETLITISGDQTPDGAGQATRGSDLPDRVGDYRLIRVIGRGGMGVVYEAKHESLNRRVALKVLSNSGDDWRETAARFQRETQLAASLHHTNIVPVFEVGCHEQTNFYAMQLIGGVDLKHWIDKFGARQTADAFAQVADIGHQVANALAFAHERGIVHRDIKPANLLIDEKKNVWVTDFGLAKTEDDGLTKTGNIVGTLRYLSPERLVGQCDARADIYSLGATLYEMVCGVAPFSASDRTELVNQILHQDPTPLRKLVTEIPLDLETIIHKAIQSEPSNRYASSRQMCDDLHRFLNGQPIFARRMSVFERFGRLVRRNKAIASALGVIFLLLISSVMLLGWGLASSWRHERIQKDLLQSGVENLYFAEMNLASAASESGTGIGRLRELVEHWDVPPSESDPRGWEWHLFNAMCHSERFVIQINDIVNSVDWAPAGDRIVSGNGGEIWIWDASTGDELSHQHFGTDAFLVTSVRWNATGDKIAVACTDGELRIWDSELRGVDFQHSLTGGDTPASLCWHPAKDTLIFQTEKGRLYRWDLTPTGVVLLSDQVAKANRCGFEFSPDGSRLGIIGKPEDGTYAVTIWDADRWEVLRVLDKSIWPYGAIAWSHDGSQIGASVYDGRSRVWAAETGKLQSTWMKDSQPVMAFDWQSNGRLIATAGFDRQVHLWSADAATTDGTVAPTTVLRGHLDTVSSARWSPDGKQLVTSSFDDTIRVWDISRLPVRQLATGGTGHISLQWSPNDDELMSVTGSGQIVWNPDTGERLREKTGVDAAWSHDRKFFACSQRSLTEAQQLRILTGNTVVKIVPIGRRDQSHTRPILSWSPTASRLAYARCSGDRENNAVVWIESFGQTGSAVELPGVLDFKCLSWHPGGTLLAVGAVAPNLDEHAVSVYDSNTGNLVKTLSANQGIIKTIAWSPDGTKLAVGGKSADIAIVDFETEEVETRLRDHTFDIYSVAWHPLGTRLASGSADKTVKLWDVKSGSLVGTFRHNGEVHSVAWSHDGTRLASMDTNGDITIRDARRSRR